MKRTCLLYTSSNPEALYLRGFTGATLEGDIWSTVDSAVLAQNQALLYWLNENAFHPAAQYASAAAGTDRGTGSVSIRNIGACSAYQYVPFSLRDTGNLPAENLKEDLSLIHILYPQRWQREEHFLPKQTVQNGGYRV